MSRRHHHVGALQEQKTLGLERKCVSLDLNLKQRHLDQFQETQRSSLFEHLDEEHQNPGSCPRPPAPSRRRAGNLRRLRCSSGDGRACERNFSKDLLAANVRLMSFQKPHFRPDLIKSATRNFKKDHPLLCMGQLTLV